MDPGLGLAALGLVKGLDFHRDAVGHLGAREAVDLLANELGAQPALALVGEHLLGVERRPFGQKSCQRAQQPLDVLAAERRERVDQLEGLQSRPALDHRQQQLPLHQIDLVQDQRQRPTRAGAADPLEQLMIGILIAGVRIDHHRHQVDIPASLFSHLVQGGAEPSLARVHTGGVDQRQLIVGRGRNPQDAGAGGLGLGADDGDLLPQQPIEERGFSGAGSSDQGDEARMKRH